MDTRIQFRVDEKVKHLAQKRVESQGRTLSDAYRELTESLADQQRQIMSHNSWLTEQVNQAFEKLTDDQAVFIDHHCAKKQMDIFKDKIRNQE